MSTGIEDGVLAGSVIDGRAAFLDIPATVPASNPCLSCGACCAHFRASFYCGELRSMGGTVPDELTERVAPLLAAMKGWADDPVRCVALAGEIGKCVSCTIYPLRSDPCREFPVAWADGSPNERCDAARCAHGLPPLIPPVDRAA